MQTRSISAMATAAAAATKTQLPRGIGAKDSRKINVSFQHFTGNFLQLNQCLTSAVPGRLFKLIYIVFVFFLNHYVQLKCMRCLWCEKEKNKLHFFFQESFFSPTPYQKIFKNGFNGCGSNSAHRVKLHI